MSELTLRDPLNSAEIVEILLQEIENRLKADSTLTSDITYSGFQANFEIKLKLQRPVPVSTLVWGEAGTPISPENGPTIDSGEVVKGEYEAGPPNVERQSHNLPVPVMIQTPTGPVKKKVHIERAGGKK